MYTVPSSAATYTALLPHFLPPRTSLPHTVVIIVLDWTKPWSFIDELYTWLEWIETWVKSDSSREAQIMREESRERRTWILRIDTSGFSDKYISAGSSATLLRAVCGTHTSNFYIIKHDSPPLRSWDVDTQFGRSTHHRNLHKG